MRGRGQWVWLIGAGLLGVGLASSASASAPKPAPKPSPKPAPAPPPVVPPPVPEPPPVPDFEPEPELEPEPDIEPEPEPEPIPGPDIEPPAPDYPDDDPSDPDAYVTWPLPGYPSDTVREWRTGDRTFGADRSDSKAGPHLHAGVDLGPSDDFYGAPVVAPAAGWIDDIDIGFLGPDARRIDIISPVYGRIVLGAVQGVAAVEKGEWVESGQLVGWIGRYPGGSTELHLEQHVDERVKWPLGDPQPDGLIDPRLGLLAKFPSKSGGGS